MKENECGFRALIKGLPMKKSLLLAALLLPFAAQAETYFCEATHEALIGMGAESSVNADFRLSVDADQGVWVRGTREGVGDAGYYSGGCSKESNIIECIGSEDLGIRERTTIFISGISIDFIFVRTNIFLPLVMSYHGKCLSV